MEQSRRILEAGKRAGLRLNFHADELTPINGTEVFRIALKKVSCYSSGAVLRRWELQLVRKL